MQYCSVQYYIMQYCSVQYYSMQYCSVQYCSVHYYSVHWTMLPQEEFSLTPWLLHSVKELLAGVFLWASTQTSPFSGTTDDTN